MVMAPARLGYIRCLRSVIDNFHRYQTMSSSKLVFKMLINYTMQHGYPPHEHMPPHPMDGMPAHMMGGYVRHCGSNAITRRVYMIIRIPLASYLDSVRVFAALHAPVYTRLSLFQQY